MPPELALPECAARDARRLSCGPDTGQDTLGRRARRLQRAVRPLPAQFGLASPRLRLFGVNPCRLEEQPAPVAKRVRPAAEVAKGERKVAKRAAKAAAKKSAPVKASAKKSTAKTSAAKKSTKKKEK